VRSTVLVLDGEQRAALATVRSLGRAGHLVHVASTVRGSIGGGSRFAASESLLPDPLGGSERYAQAVRDIALTRGAKVILPITEPATLALLESAEQLSGLTLPTSDLARFRAASDKEAVLALAGSIGIDVPQQWTVTSADRATIPADAFPVVVKPARSVVGSDGQRKKTTVRYADTPAQLQAVLAELGLIDGPLLVQQRIEGHGVGVFLLRWEGQVVATFAHRRLREKPPSGGVSVCCESVIPPDALIEQSARLLAALDWQGVAMVEYKHDIRSGKDYLMEINPRFWGSLQLAIDSGVDFPALLLALASGQRPQPVHHWRIGVRSRWCWGEIDHLVARLRRSDAELHLAAGSPGKLRTALTVLSPWRPRTRSDVWRWSDPRPGLRESLAWFQTLGR
jgi:predicted ATP-grasp superfamily ATP-dependent carboligase